MTAFFLALLCDRVSLAKMSIMETLNMGDERSVANEETKPVNTIDRLMEWKIAHPERSEKKRKRDVEDDATAATSKKGAFGLRFDDRQASRMRANVLALERLYRRTFCAGVSPANGGGFTVRGEIIPRNADIGNDEVRDVAKYKCPNKLMTKETLAENIDQLIRSGYSLNYVFSYMAHLRQKYRLEFPLNSLEQAIFNRSIVDRYHKGGDGETTRKKATDEVYTESSETYEAMKRWCWSYLISDETTIDNSKSTRNALIRFAYSYLFMFYTGKRLSEICVIKSEDLVTLRKERSLAVVIPKTKKTGRITLESLSSDEMRSEFEAFLDRVIALFVDIPNSPYLGEKIVPFDQFEHRKSIDRYFAKVYVEATGRPKPRGLSMHSLRRYRAAENFQEGLPLELIREQMDHSSTSMTNTYINKHLLRSYRNKKLNGLIKQI